MSSVGEMCEKEEGEGWNCRVDLSALVLFVYPLSTNKVCKSLPLSC